MQTRRRIIGKGLAALFIALGLLLSTVLLSGSALDTATPCGGTWWIEPAELAANQPLPEFGFASCDGEARSIADFQGQPLLINFWATWCPPCLREFPDIVQVYEENSAKGLEVFAVSMNDAEEVEDIEEFLQSFEPPFGIYRAASLDSAFFESILDTWYGEMPMTMIFDTAGERVHVYKKALTYEELAADVAALIPAP